MHKRILGSSLAFALSSTSVAQSFNDDQFDIQHTKVYTPALMDQGIADTPGAITVITAKQIKELGIRSIVEALRLVPGFDVDYGNPLSYANRGPNVPTPRRMQVLVDGVSEVNPLVGVVRYDFMPVAIERISRIEVVRSQSAAAYGSNAFLGTVNIITQPPKGNKTETVASASQRGHDVYVGEALKGTNTSAELDYRGRTHSQFDKFPVSGDIRHDNIDTDTLRANTLTHLRNGDEVETMLSAVRGDFQAPKGGGLYATDDANADQSNNEAAVSYKTRIDSHTLKANAYNSYKDFNYNWNVCAPKALFKPELGLLYRDNSALVMAAINRKPLPAATPDQLARLSSAFAQIAADPASFSTVCGVSHVDYRYKTQVATLNDVWVATPDLTMSTSAELEHRRMISVIYGDGTTTIDKSKIFTNAEYRHDAFTFNAGIMAESLGYALYSPQLSPRLGVSYHINDRNTVKFVASEGKRLIDGIEIITKNQIPTYFDSPVYGSTRQSGFSAYFPVYGDRDHVDTIDSYEILFYSNWSLADVETRYFQERLRNILNYQDGAPSNIADYSRDGGEFAVTLHFGDIETRFSGHYQESNSKSALDDYTEYGGSAYLIKRFDDGITATLAYYGSSAIAYSGYDRTDLRLAKTFRVEKTDVEVAGTLSHHRTDYVRTFLYDHLDGGTLDHPNELTVEFRASM